MALQITIATAANGWLTITAGGTGTGKVWSVAPNTHVVPYRNNDNLILLTEKPNDWDITGGLRINWNNITSPVVTSRIDAISKISLLQSSSSGVYQTTIAGGLGASVTVDTFTFTSDNYSVYADGVLMTTGYTRAGQVITFSPAIADGVVITVIKF